MNLTYVCVESKKLFGSSSGRLTISSLARPFANRRSHFYERTHSMRRIYFNTIIQIKTINSGQQRKSHDTRQLTRKWNFMRSAVGNCMQLRHMRMMCGLLYTHIHGSMPRLVFSTRGIRFSCARPHKRTHAKFCWTDPQFHSMLIHINMGAFCPFGVFIEIYYFSCVYIMYAINLN